jgi:predicted MFS family arabinose efflux permease
MVEYRDPDADRVDTAGLATFSAALFLLVFALLRGNNEGWGSTVIVASLVGAVVLLGLFVAIERRQSRPMLDLGLFRSPAFAGVSIGTFALGSGMFGLILYISLYFQNELGYSPLQAGLRFVPFSAMVFVVPLVTRRLVARLPARVPLSGGLLLTAVGLLMMHGVTVSSHWTAILPGMLVAGVGVGFCNPAIGSTALAVVHPARSGMASGFNNTCRLAGVATGIAALGAIFQHDIATGLAQRLPNVPAGVADVVSSSGPHAALRAVPAADRLQVLDASRHAFTDAINSLFLAGSATVLVGALAAGLLIRARDLHGHGAPSPAAEGATAA